MPKQADVKKVVLLASAALGLTSKPAYTPGVRTDGELVSLILGVGVTVDVRTTRGVGVLVALATTTVGELFTTGTLVGVETVTRGGTEATTVKLGTGTRVKVERAIDVGSSTLFENGESKAQLVIKSHSTNKMGAT